MNVEQLLEQARDAARARGEVSEFTASKYYGPSDEPLSWDRSGVVRLDFAIYALHLASARVACRSWPQLLRQRIQRTKEKLVETMAKREAQAAVVALPGFIGLWINFFILVREVWQEEKIQREAEQAVRRGVLRTMRELLAMKMKTKNKKRRVLGRVASRHP